MKLLLKAHGNLDFTSIAQYAFLDLTVELAEALLKKRSNFRLINASGDGLVRILYWGDCTWFGSAAPKDPPAEGWPASWKMEDEFDEPSEGFLRSSLSKADFGQIENGGSPVVMPETFVLPTDLIDETEMGMLQVEDSGVRYRTYPRHCEHTQDTDEIPWALIEQAARV